MCVTFLKVTKIFRKMLLHFRGSIAVDYVLAGSICKRLTFGFWGQWRARAIDNRPDCRGGLLPSIFGNRT